MRMNDDVAGNQFGSFGWCVIAMDSYAIRTVRFRSLERVDDGTVISTTDSI